MVVFNSKLQTPNSDCWSPAVVTQSIKNCRSSIVLESRHLVMFLSFFTFALFVRCIQSSEPYPRNQPSYVDKSQFLLHQDPFLRSRLRDYFDSPTSKVITTAISESAATIDGYLLTQTYKKRQCQGDTFSQVSAVSLNFCYNSSSKYSAFSFKYSFTSPTSNMSTQLYLGAKCEQKLTQPPVEYPRCLLFSSFTYSPTLSLPKLPAEPYARIT
jgi:hypothetical protein